MVRTATHIHTQHNTTHTHTQHNNNNSNAAQCKTAYDAITHGKTSTNDTTPPQQHNTPTPHLSPCSGTLLNSQGLLIKPKWHSWRQQICSYQATHSTTCNTTRHFPCFQNAERMCQLLCMKWRNLIFREHGKCERPFPHLIEGWETVRHARCTYTDQEEYSWFPQERVQGNPN
jgi:hypothetical protein